MVVVLVCMAELVVCGEVKLAVGAYSSGEEASSSQRWRVNLAGRSVRLRQWWKGLVLEVCGCRVERQLARRSVWRQQWWRGLLVVVVAMW